MKKLLLSSVIVLSIAFYVNAQSNCPGKIPSDLVTASNSKQSTETDLYLAWEVFKIILPMVI